jgi:hypothetical protein
MSVRLGSGLGVGDGVFGRAQKAFGEVHGDTAVGDVDGVDPGQDERDEDGFGAGGLFYG